jgi:hypothetical protein
VRGAEDIIEIVRFSDSLIEGRKFIFLDEITFADRWQNAIKYIIDSPLARNKVIYVRNYHREGCKYISADLSDF